MAIIFDNVTYLDEIKHATFGIADGKITGIVGNVDSYKSTLIDLMGGLVYSNGGHVIYGNTYLEDIGILYEDVSEQFFFDQIINDFYLTLKRHHVRNVEKKIFDSLKMMHLSTEYLYRSPYSLSLSEYKKISLALVLSYNPKVILLNEPFLGLDAEDKEYLIKLICMMKIRYGKTIVIASKDTDIIHRLADEVILMDDGRVLKAGDKYDVLSDEKLLKQCKLDVPKLIMFSNLVLEKKVIDLGYRDDINDLAKDIYRYLR